MSDSDLVEPPRLNVPPWSETLRKDRLSTGDPAPFFAVRSTNNANFQFSSAGGRYLVLCFFGSLAGERNRKTFELLTTRRRERFDDFTMSFFGVSMDPDDEQQGRARQSLPGIRHFWDFDGGVTSLYAGGEPASLPSAAEAGFTLVIDPFMRVIANIPFGEPEQHADAVSAVLDRLPAPSLHAGAPTPAPVLMLPRVFEPELCRALIDLYEWRGGGDSGFMKDENGRTVAVLDHSFKRRSDVSLEDSPEYESYRAAIRARVVRRILPEIQKAFQFQITRMERYLIACYDSGTGGFFKAHRDNTTLGTVHRRFAVTINLNAEEYEGGDLRFPEFGDQTYRAPTGGCVVFSCGLLHEARPVTRGRRYACLPFLYDEAGAAVRARNRELVNLDVVNRNAAAAGAAIARGAKVP